MRPEQDGGDWLQFDLDGNGVLPLALKQRGALAAARWAAVTDLVAPARMAPCVSASAEDEAAGPAIDGLDSEADTPDAVQPLSVLGELQRLSRAYEPAVADEALLGHPAVEADR
ncbi:MAG: hypothetical protein AAFR00_04005 [Pseudomonadota bacterium]